MAQFIKTSAFAEWVNTLKDRKGRALILARVDRFQETGHAGDAKAVGGGVSEMRIAFGPGYRVYFTVLGDTVILLGGDKSTQTKDIKDGPALRQDLEGKAEMKDKQVEFSAYDTAEFLRTPEEIADYLKAVFENYGDEHRTIIKALGTVARAQGMQKIADATGLQRQGLYKSLSDEGNPSFETVLKVMNAVGVELRPKAMAGKHAGFHEVAYAVGKDGTLEQVRAKSEAREHRALKKSTEAGQALRTGKITSRKRTP